MVAQGAIALGQKVALFTVGRSGSQFVCRLLKAYLDVELEEWLSPSYVKEASCDDEFLTYLKGRLADPRGGISIKVTPHIYDPYWQDRSALVDDVMAATAYARQFFLYRSDFLALCASFWHALNSGRWHSDQPLGEPVPTSLLEVAGHLLDSEGKMFSLFLAHAEACPATISYEHLLWSPYDFSRTILNYLDPCLHVPGDIALAGMPRKLIAPGGASAQALLDGLDPDERELFQAIHSERQRRLTDFLAKTVPL